MSRIFTCKYSPEVAQLLYDLHCTLIISSHSSNRVLLQSSTSSGELIQKPRNFPSPMGIAISDNKIAISSSGEITFLQKIDSTKFLENLAEQNFDCMYVPRHTYHCGNLKIHEIAFGKEGLWIVNTEFSCLGLLSEQFSFEPKWYPQFISKPNSGDACHLNGLALEDGTPKFVSALGTSNLPHSWKDGMKNGGCVIDIESNEFVLCGLSVPHSPRLINDKFYLLQSGTGEVLTVDTHNSSYNVMTRLPGFVRGLDHYGQYLFVGYSKIRKSSGFENLEISKKETFCGIAVIHKISGNIIGKIQFENSVEEVFDIKIIPNVIAPELLSPYDKNYHSLIHTPDNIFFI